MNNEYDVQFGNPELMRLPEGRRLEDWMREEVANMQQDEDERHALADASKVNSLTLSILHEAFDLIKPLYGKYDPPTTYRDRVGYVLTALQEALEGTDYAIGNPLPLGEWCICTGNESKATPKPKFDYEAIRKYQQEQHAKGQCEIGLYVLGLHCTQAAKHAWGHGSIIHVCDIHSTWNPFMVEGGKCPDCGKLADHYPCNVCPGCGMTVYANNTTATLPDGTIPVGDDGKPVRIYHGNCKPAAEMFTIEFEIYGTEGKRWAVCYGDNPQDAIHNFLHEYSSMRETIVAIRVPGVKI